MTQQKHCIVNLTKKAGFEPRSVGNGTALTEFAREGVGAMGALVLLLDGDWGGERVAIVGDNAQTGDLPPDAEDEAGTEVEHIHRTVVACSGTEWTNVGWLARKVIKNCNLGEVGETRKGSRHYIYTAEANPDLGGQVMEPDRIIWNVDKFEFVTPEGFGDDPSLGIFTVQAGDGGVLTALGALLAGSNRGGARGRGDLNLDHPLIGSWAGDRIAVVSPRGLGASARAVTNIDAATRQMLTNAGESTYVRAQGSWTRYRNPIAA